MYLATSIIVVFWAALNFSDLRKNYFRYFFLILVAFSLQTIGDIILKTFDFYQTIFRVMAIEIIRLALLRSPVVRGLTTKSASSTINFSWFVPPSIIVLFNGGYDNYNYGAAMGNLVFGISYVLIGFSIGIGYYYTVKKKSFHFHTIFYSMTLSFLYLHINNSFLSQNSTGDCVLVIILALAAYLFSNFLNKIDVSREDS